jgi:ParB family transcriptional regulator, chromosome partitioning protein
LGKLYSNSLLILGIIDDIDIHRIKSPTYLHRVPVPDDLIESIKKKGLLQPIIIRPLENCFEIVAGNRRFQACKTLGWKKIICHIVELSDKEAFEISLIENIQRKSLNPIEEAQSFKKYVDSLGWGGISELASKIGKSVAYVDKRIKLLELPPAVLSSISLAEISPTAGEELLSIRNLDAQSHLANLIQQKKLSSRDIRRVAKSLKEGLTCSNNECNNFPLMDLSEIDNDIQKVFDKSITILKIHLQKLSSLISETEGNWIIYETMMQHKFVLDTQIDILIKEKRKFRTCKILKNPII